MFKEGNILYFEPFYFENGNTPKPKYFLVLKEVDNQLILASLPTSHDHIPSNMSKVHGCIDDSTINFNCYYFKAGKDIAFSDVAGETFSFPRAEAMQQDHFVWLRKDPDFLEIVK